MLAERLYLVAFKQSLLLGVQTHQIPFKVSPVGTHSKFLLIKSGREGGREEGARERESER